MGGTTVKTDSSGTNQSVQSNKVDPQQMQMLQDNNAGAQARAATLTPYTGQMVAGFNPTQTQAQGVLSGIGTDQSYGNVNQGAIQGAQGVLSGALPSTITPKTVTPSLIGAQAPVIAGSLANTDLSPYMSPYTKDVINASVAQNEQARKIAQVSDAQQATAQGAFGGSRSGVAAGVTNGQYDLNDQNFIANQNANNFSQAQSAASGDINRNLSNDQFNATTGLNVAGQNAGAQNNANQFNATNDQNAQQSTFNNRLAASGLTLNAAGQIVALNNQALGTAATQGGILGAVGDAQQQQQQASLSAAYQAYMDGQQLTVEQQQLLNSALGLVPVQQTVSGSGSSTGNSTQKTSGGLGMLGGLLGGLGSLGQGLGANGLGW